MAKRTFNRSPIQINTPSSNDVKNNFFNHFNWKGVTDDRNVFGVDQETFSDANNVYIDSEGLLRSRPSLKIKVVQYKNGEETMELSDIVDVWTFNNVTVYQSLAGTTYYLTFVNSNFEDMIQVPLTVRFGSTDTGSYKDIRPILADNKVFIFSEHDFTYYDIKENTYAQADDFVYVPVTSAVHGNEIEEIESLNLLTSSFITRYLYDNSGVINFTDLVGKTISITIDGQTYTIDFTYNSELLIVKRYTGLSEFNKSEELLLGQDGQNIPLIQLSDSGLILVSSYEMAISSATGKPTIEWTMYYSLDGTLFEQLPNIQAVIGQPLLSKDGYYAIAFKSDGPYIYSLVATTADGKKYPRWTHLLNALYPDYKETLGYEIDFNSTGSGSSRYTFNQTTQVNGHFLTDNIFAFTYATGRVSVSETVTGNLDNPTYENLYCVHSDGNKLWRAPVFCSTNELKVNYTWDNTIPPTNEEYVDQYFLLFSGNESVDGPVGPTGVSYTTYTKRLQKYENYRFATPSVDGKPIAYLTIDEGYIEYTKSNYVDGPGYSTILLYLKTTITEGTKTYTNEGFYHTRDEFDPSRAFFDFQGSLEFGIPADNYSSTPSGGFENTIRYVNGEFRLNILPGNYFTTSETVSETLLPTDTAEFTKGLTDNYMPSVYTYLESDIQYILINFRAQLPDNIGNHYFKGIRCITTQDPDEWDWYRNNILDYEVFNNRNLHRSPLKDAMIINNRIYKIARLNKNGNTKVINIKTVALRSWSNNHTSAKTTSSDIFIEPYINDSDFMNQRLVFSQPSGFLITNDYLFNYLDFTDTSRQYEPLELLFTAVPVGLIHGVRDVLYLATDNALYATDLEFSIEIDEVSLGGINPILPEAYTLLQNYYFANGNELMISKLTNSESGQFKWYFPAISKQTFDNKITNLHNISTTEVALFTEKEIWYVSYDGETTVGDETGVYRYTKSRLSVGCKSGSDVITSFDGKYTIFPSSRGLVSMSYQDFIASTEQSLTYLSDTIYTPFINYINEAESKNEIKLFKFGYWILVYKQDSNRGYIFDTRNSSWWPISSVGKAIKFVDISDSVQLLSDGKMHSLNKADTNYFDYFDKKYKVEWFIKSQKLHFNAINNYKHIVNMTFVSIHNTQALQASDVNVEDLDFKLQVNCYRKKVNGNVNEPDDYLNVNYKVESIRTFVQRLNYSKINEFQYQISYDDENAFEIPLSLNSISIKYKVGGQVR